MITISFLRAKITLLFMGEKRMKKIRVISFLCALLMVCSICVTTISTAVFADSSTPTTQPVPTTRTYTVRHIRQTLSGSYEDESLAEYETLTGNVGDMTQALANRTYPGFQALIPEQVQIAPSGDITVSVYYARKKLTTYFHTGDPAQDFHLTYLYESTQTQPAQPTIPGKVFIRWAYQDSTGALQTWNAGIQPAEDMHVYAEYDIPFQSTYIINYWYQNATDELSFTDAQKTYTLFNTETKTQNVNSTVVYNGLQYDTTYRKYNQAKTDAENATKLVLSDGSTVVNVYYDRPVMTVTLVYYNFDTNTEERRESFQEIYGHKTEGVYSLDEKYLWSAPNNPNSHFGKTQNTFKEERFFNIDDYHLEFHARKLAETPKDLKIHLVYHDQNKDGTWSEGTENRKKDIDTLSYSTFSLYFTNTASFNYAYYYWTNSADEYTTDVSSSNPNLNSYTSGSEIVIYRNGQVVNDYDGDGHSYIHVYLTRNKYNLHLENTDGTVLNLYYGEPLSNYKNILDNPVKPNNVPAHYVFAGWYTSDTFREGTKMNDNATMSSRDRFIYAKWEEPNVNVTIVSNGATSTLPEIVTIPMMSSVRKDIPNIPSKDGYWFAGWYKDPAFTQPFDINESISYDMTIYAKWLNRKPTSWRIRYIDDQGRVLAQEDTGVDNLYTVLFRYGKLIPDYAVDYESKNLTLSSDQMNLLDFIYTYRVKTNWVTEEGTPIKERVYGTFGPEVFDGYVYVSTNTAVNGDTTHVYRWVGISTPKTADYSQMAWYMSVLCLSSLAVVSIAFMKKSYR